MPQQIQVPGMGVVEFPDGMSDDQIADAIKKNMPQAQEPSFWDDKSVGGFVANAGRNLLEEGKNVVKTAQTFTNPIAAINQGREFAQGINQLSVKDILAQAGEYAADPASLATDVGNYAYEKPFSTALNASAVAGGAGLAVRGAALASGAAQGSRALRVADVLDTASRRTDPLLGAAQAGSKLYRGAKNVAHTVTGITSSVGPTGVKFNAQAGADAAYGKTSEKVAKGMDRLGLGNVRGTAMGRGIAKMFEGDRRYQDVIEGHRAGEPEIDVPGTVQSALQTARKNLNKEFFGQGSQMESLLGGMKGLQIDYKPIENALDALRRDSVSRSGSKAGAATDFWDEADAVIKSHADIAVPEQLRSVLGDSTKLDGLQRLYKLASRDPDTLEDILTTPARSGGLGMSDAQAARVMQEIPTYQKVLSRQIEELAEATGVPIKTVGELRAAREGWRGTPEGLEGLRESIRDLENKYQGTNPAAKSIAARIRRTVAEEMDKQFAAKGAPQGAVTRILQKYSNERASLEDAARTFSLDSGTQDTILRRLTSVLRDTVHTNFGSRRRALKRLLDDTKTQVPDAKYLRAALAGEATQAGLRSNLFMTGLSGGSALGLGFGLTLSPQFALMAAPLFIAHSPKLMGKLAFRGGQAEALIHKPLKGAANMLAEAQKRWFGEQLVGRRGVLESPVQVERLVSSWDENEEQAFKREILMKAKDKGLPISEKVLDRIAEDLLSGDSERYLRALETIGRNKRLMTIFDGGTKGEQGE